MENFFKWMTKPLPIDDVQIWFNVNNMIPERIELYGDLFKGLHKIMVDTYLGSEDSETKINLTQDDKLNHFEWCWKTLIENFQKENIKVKETGHHKDYFWEFFNDTFYNQKDKKVQSSVPLFIDDLFNLQIPFTKSDLDILTELYKSLEKNIEV